MYLWYLFLLFLWLCVIIIVTHEYHIRIWNEFSFWSAVFVRLWLWLWLVGGVISYSYASSYDSCLHTRGWFILVICFFAFSLSFFYRWNVSRWSRLPEIIGRLCRIFSRLINIEIVSLNRSIDSHLMRYVKVFSVCCNAKALQDIIDERCDINETIIINWHI